MPGRYLITGVAGSGKSTLEREFAARGFATVDIDNGFAEWRHADTDEPLEYTPEDAGWHEVAEWTVKKDKLQQYFDEHPEQPVLVFGSFARIDTVVSMFTKIILLEYPDVETARTRIAGRPDGYGSNPHELKRILSYIDLYQDKMKSRGAIPLQCTLPIAELVRAIEGLIDE